MEEVIGIDNIKKALKFAGNFTKAIVESLKDDGKIKGFEYFKIAFTLPDLYPVIKNISVIIDEFEDLDDTEYVEVCEYFKKEFDIPNDEVEEKIEKAFDFIISIADLFDGEIPTN